MTRTMSLTAAALLAALPAAVAPAGAQELGPEPTARSVAGWAMPWQIARVDATALNAEEIVTAWVPGRGMVRGTQATIDMIGKPLPEAPGPNRTIAACAEQVQSAARAAQAESVEWASSSRERRLSDGTYFATVEFRITYPTTLGYDIRDQPLVCVTRADGTMVDAYMAESKDAVETPTRYTSLAPARRAARKRSATAVRPAAE